MADTVVVKRTENRLIVTKEDKKARITAPYVKNINQYAYSLTVLGYYENLSALVAGVSTPDVGDVYGVGTSAPYTIYIWDGTSWVDNGTIKGDKGDPTEWLRGTVDPNTEGVDGDLYLNYTTWHVWEKISGTWTDRGSIKGVDGTDGTDGVGIPTIAEGDAGKVLSVNSTNDGLEYTELPLASETVKGVVELATSAEVLAGEDTERAVTPEGLSNWSKTPVGTIITYPVDSIPSHCLECNGATISRETYSELFTAIGTTYGAGDGSTTFKIPDLRGEFIRGWDHARGIDASRIIGSGQADQFKAHTHTGTPKDFTGATSDYFGGSTADYGFDLTGNTEATGGTETRPRNVAMMFCIVYE